MRRFLWLTFGFGLLGDLLAILIAPKIIRYWYEVPVAGATTMVSNSTAVLNYGMEQLIKYQMIGTALGMVLGVLVAFLLWRRAKHKAELEAARTAALPAQQQQVAAKT